MGPSLTSIFGRMTGPLPGTLPMLIRPRIDKVPGKGPVIRPKMEVKLEPKPPVK